MRKIILAITLAGFAISSVGCITKEQIAADEAKVAAVVAAAKKGAQVASDAVLGSINTVCGYLGDLNADKAAVQNIILSTTTTPGPKTQANLANVDRAVSAASAICAQSSAGTGNTVANLILLWSYYNSGRTAVNAAKLSGGAA